ncbi:MAG: hypothetical protein LBH53_03495, partial [Puniceicoccales bacterium]|nr:hypothetical protein [Puniceicoccales bacterium]
MESLTVFCKDHDIEYDLPPLLLSALNAFAKEMISSYLPGGTPNAAGLSAENGKSMLAAGEQSSAVSTDALVQIALNDLLAGKYCPYYSLSALGGDDFLRWLAGTALVNGCGDRLEIPSTEKIIAFCTIDGGTERHKSASSIKLDGTSLVTGLACGAGPLTFGPFFEGAWARTLTENEAGGKSERSGKGHGRA